MTNSTAAPATFLTLEGAADLLNVSVPFVLRAIETGEISHRQVGGDCLVPAADLHAYKQRLREQSVVAMAELARLDRELGLGQE